MSYLDRQIKNAVVNFLLEVEKLVVSHLSADPDPTFHFDMDQDSDPTI
jgi:hypothetical protein